MANEKRDAAPTVGQPGPAAEVVIFADHCLPVMQAGKYTVSATLSVNGNTDFEPAAKDFYIDAPRFLLDPADVYSVYPAKESRGSYEYSLPHVVLNRRTLPWERTIDGKPHLSEPQAWMGLLLLNEKELLKDAGGTPLTTKPRTLKEMTAAANGPAIRAGKSVLSAYEVALSPWDGPDTQVQTIDLPLATFKGVMPRKSDLPFLAHLRQVDVNNGKEAAAIGDGGYFATILGNRIIPWEGGGAEERYHVFLVSLEGFGAYFNDNNFFEGKETVSLIVLTSWSFTQAPGGRFEDKCNRLKANTGVFKVDIEAKIKAASAELPAGQASVFDAYDHGYVLMPYQLRNGTRTYGWYRGPLNPNFVPSQRSVPYGNADALLRVDPNTGMVDISYAAAWQLGRLLALKDKAFHSAYFQWKVQNRREKLKREAQDKLSETLKPEIDTVVSKLRAKGQARAGDDIYQQALAELQNDGGADSATAQLQVRILQDIYPQWPQPVAEQFQPIAPPAEMRQWLTDLYLLKGVPLNYLVPHEYFVSDVAVKKDGDGFSTSVAGKETVRAFFLDYDWLDALLAGALSIIPGFLDNEKLMDQVRAGHFFTGAYKQAIDEVVKASGEGDPREMQAYHFTGFIMRSELLSGWKGTKIFAAKANGELADAFRVEKLEEDMLIALVMGKVSHLDIIQPSEGIQFGILANDAGDFLIETRKFDNGRVSGLPGPVKVAMTASSPGGFQLIDLAATARAIGGKLGIAGGTASPAVMASQLLMAPVIYSLLIDHQLKQ